MNSVWPALIAATAALGGVTIGVLLEPLKLGAARRARIRQERLERSAQLIEMGSQILDRETDTLQRWERISQFRTLVAVLGLYGPDRFTAAAEAANQAMEGWVDVRMGKGGAGLDAAATAFHEALREFAVEARRHR